MIEIFDSSKIETGKSVVSFPEDYTVIDLETTGLSKWYDEIIELAALRVRGGKVVDSYQQLIKPTYPICEFISELTGITNELVSDAPSINEKISEFVDFIGEDLVVGHNVKFDIGFTSVNYFKCSDSLFCNDWINTVRLAKRILPKLDSYRLCCCCECANVTLDVEAHRALNDCYLTQSLFEKMRSKVLETSPDYSILEELFPPHHRSKYSGLDIKSIKCQIPMEEIDSDNPFYNKNVVFTGTLSIPRRQAAQIVANLGGHLQNTITKVTNFLILGCNDYCHTIKDGKSTKQKTAERYILDGCEISIIDERTFLEMLKEDK